MADAAAPPGASLFLIGGLKGVEYGVLGLAVGWLGKKACAVVLYTAGAFAKK
jgi:hypothetical protein